MVKKEDIYNLFFIKKLNTVEIGLKLNISQQYVSKLLAKHPLYKEERKRRKQTNKQKKIKNDDEYQYLKVQHNQAVREMSSGRRINSLALRNWNRSAYNYNSNKNRYEFDNATLTKPRDFPEYIY